MKLITKKDKVYDRYIIDNKRVREEIYKGGEGNRDFFLELILNRLIKNGYTVTYFSQGCGKNLYFIFSHVTVNGKRKNYYIDAFYDEITISDKEYSKKHTTTIEFF